MKNETKQKPMSQIEREMFAPLLNHARKNGARLTPSLHDIADEDNPENRWAKKEVSDADWHNTGSGY